MTKLYVMSSHNQRQFGPLIYENMPYESASPLNK